MNNILSDFNKNDCSGCSACFSVCPKKAIEMVPDEKGFLYPSVDFSECINCGICLSVCDFRKFKIDTSKSFKCFAFADNDERLTSQSGGAFASIAKYVLSKNGVVFGCFMKDDGREIKHILCENVEQLQLLKKSKYVSSDIKETFLQCIDYLKKGKIVLFSGTGCQIHGLLSLLKIKNIPTNNLITCDLICHGVPSQQVWNDYLTYIEKKADKTIVKVIFRDKDFKGWHSHAESFLFSDGTKIFGRGWATNFYLSTMFRESCYNCKYTTPYRDSDFTIADCWGVEKYYPDLNDNKGVSLIIARGDKSIRILECISQRKICREVDYERVIQPQLIHPIQKSVNYNCFWKRYFKNRHKTISKWFNDDNSVFIKSLKLKEKIYRLVRRKNNDV